MSRTSGSLEDGIEKILWVSRHCSILTELREEFKKEKPFEGIKIALSIHLEAKTAYLCEVLKDGGAEMYVTGSNPLSTQNDVARALAEYGCNVFAKYDCTEEEYSEGIDNVLKIGPDIIIDDGGDLVAAIIEKYPDLAKNVIGGCEETTTGILRLKKLAKNGDLPFTMVTVNDADCKHLFDNRYGTGQSVWDGINRTTNLIVAGKTVVVAGYGWCGKGVAMRAKGLGAKVIVTEVDPVKAIEAVMDGFEVKQMKDAAEIGDIFITVTGCEDVICIEHIQKMKNEALLCNAGHFDCEIDMASLNAKYNHTKVRENIEQYQVGDKKINVLGEGRLVNLACGDGHPVEIMDMSFAIQALSAKFLVEKVRGNREKFDKVVLVPEEVDRRVAEIKLKSLGIAIDTLTEKQRNYLGI